MESQNSAPHRLYGSRTAPGSSPSLKWLLYLVGALLFLFMLGYLVKIAFQPRIPVAPVVAAPVITQSLTTDQGGPNLNGQPLMAPTQTTTTTTDMGTAGVPGAPQLADPNMPQNMVPGIEGSQGVPPAGMVPSAGMVPPVNQANPNFQSAVSTTTTVQPTNPQFAGAVGSFPPNSGNLLPQNIPPQENILPSQMGAAHPVQTMSQQTQINSTTVTQGRPRMRRSSRLDTTVHTQSTLSNSVGPAIAQVSNFIERSGNTGLNNLRSAWAGGQKVIDSYRKGTNSALSSFQSFTKVSQTSITAPSSTSLLRRHLHRQ